MDDFKRKMKRKTDQRNLFLQKVNQNEFEEKSEKQMSCKCSKVIFMDCFAFFSIINWLIRKCAEIPLMNSHKQIFQYMCVCVCFFVPKCNL